MLPRKIPGKEKLGYSLENQKAEMLKQLKSLYQGCDKTHNYIDNAETDHS